MAVRMSSACARLSSVQGPSSLDLGLPSSLHWRYQYSRPFLLRCDKPPRWNRLRRIVPLSCANCVESRHGDDAITLPRPTATQRPPSTVLMTRVELVPDARREYTASAAHLPLDLEAHLHVRLEQRMASAASVIVRISPSHLEIKAISLHPAQHLGLDVQRLGPRRVIPTANHGHHCFRRQLRCAGCSRTVGTKLIVSFGAPEEET